MIYYEKIYYGNKNNIFSLLQMIYGLRPIRV